MMRFVAASLGAVLLLSASAQAQQPTCTPSFKDTRDALRKDFGETVTGIGVTAGGKNLLTILSSPGGSWTAFVVMPNGSACVLATGEAWQAIAPVIGEPS
jgi:hypothetical protein